MIKENEDILLKQKNDRRLLSNVPDKHAIRTNNDRRGNAVLEECMELPEEFIANKNAGIRYLMETDVSIKCSKRSEEKVRGKLRS